LQIIYRD